MKFSKQWLQEWLSDTINTDELIEQLPMLGHEIDSVEPVSGEFTGVIVAEVVACKQHPNADRLRICEVNTGSETVSVVCGAKNARAGIKVALATVGAVLPGDFKIKRSKLRGEESLGMICSEVELGLAQTSEGILELPADAPVGEDIREYLKLDDMSIEVDLTPNRGDCLSVAGIAREIAAKNSLKLITPKFSSYEPVCDDTLSVRVEEGENCPSYVGRVIKNINNKGTSPLWLREKLRRSGLRPILPVVDVTNYILLELGQPLHAFDLAKVNKGIHVRFPNPGEKITLLSEDEIKLKDNTLVIADETGPIAMAGIMGGLNSSCTEETQSIFLESALFSPQKIVGKARQYGLHTDSSHRFERGVDPALQHLAIERATKLLVSIVGGEPGPIISVIDKAHLPNHDTIFLHEAKLKKLLGVDIAHDEISGLLTDLHMELTPVENGWNVIPPSFRYDVAHAEDLVEEVARFYGYNKIPLHQPESPIGSLPFKETQVTPKAWRHCLMSLGYHEAITYSFVDPKIQTLLDPEVKPLALSNPISAELSVMRTNLWAGLLNAVQHNQHRQQARVRLFEIGKRFVPSGNELIQEEVISAVVTGDPLPEQWGEASRKLDFYDIKGHVEALLELTGNIYAFKFTEGQHSSLHPGQSSRLIYNEKEAGWIGALHPQIQQSLGLNGPVFLFELKQEVLNKARLPEFASLSKFPSIRRDLALVVKDEVNAGALTQVIEDIAQGLLVDLSIFDVYKGKGLPEGHKSIAIALTLQDKERTLVDDDVNKLMNRVLKALKEQLQASLRE